MFASLKQKLATFKIDDLRPQDDIDRAIQALVDRATSEELIAPAWDRNLAIVDFINQNAELGCAGVGVPGASDGLARGWRGVGWGGGGGIIGPARPAPSLAPTLARTHLPPPRSVISEKLLRIFRRSMAKPNAKTQLLTLTVRRFLFPFRPPDARLAARHHARVCAPRHAL
jgi:hypothetical protein